MIAIEFSKTQPARAGSLSRPVIIDGHFLCRCMTKTDIRELDSLDLATFICPSCRVAVDLETLQKIDSPAVAITPAQAVAADGLPATDGARGGEGTPTITAEQPAAVRDSARFTEALLAEAVSSAADAAHLIRSRTGPLPTTAMWNAADNLRILAEAITTEIKRYAMTRPDSPPVMTGDIELLLARNG